MGLESLKEFLYWRENYPRMKFTIMFLFLLLIVFSSLAQQDTRERGNSGDSPVILTDSEPASDKNPRYNSSFTSSNVTQIFVKENVAAPTSNLKLSSLEKEISNLEEMESEALLKGDTATLKKLWVRDFRKDISSSKGKLPHYLSFTRVVERINVNGNSVFTSGYESYLILRPNVPLGDPIKRYYFHVWTKQNGSWKLVSRSAN